MARAIVRVGVSLFLAAMPVRAHEREILRYDWRLLGFSGALAGLFLPNSGSATLTTGPEADGSVQSELLLTAPSSRKGEFWRYGAKLDPRDGRTLRAWSTYLFRGEMKSKAKELGEAGTIDVASGIYLIRRNPPRARQPMRIWSDGKEYPVEVVPGPLEQRKIAGRRVAVRRYAIVGVERPGERLWKGSLDLYLTEDDEAVPVEILVERGWAAVRLRLADEP
jgi:hypothetical protein